MPVIHVKGSEPRTPLDAEKGLHAISSAVAQALGTDVGQVWCTYTNIETQTIGNKVPEWEDRILYLELLMKPRGKIWLTGPSQPGVPRPRLLSRSSLKTCGLTCWS